MTRTVYPTSIYGGGNPSSIALLARGPRVVDDTTGIAEGDLPHHESTTQPISPASTLMRLFELPVKHRGAVFLTFAVLTVVAAMGLSQLRSSVRILNMFADDSPLNQSYRWFEEHVGPTMTGELLVTFDVEDGGNPIERFQTVQSMHRAMLHTTIICGSALAIFYASEFKPTQRFAIFMGILLVMAWLGVTVLLPAMMTSRIGRWLASR